MGRSRPDDTESALEIDESVDSMLMLLHELPADDAGRAKLRDDIICAWSPLARRLAARFRNRGEDLDDLIQVAMLGLINAVDRFDPAKGLPFVHYAVPTILGELKRHFRDRAWALHVHRSLQELHLAVCRAVPELSQRLQRTPTAQDIADYLDVQIDDVLQGMQCATAYTARSLNTPVTSSDTQTELGELVGDVDRDMEMLPDRQALRQALQTLPEREREILQLRFVDNLTQSEIASKIGVSQMHVSRLLARAFVKLREEMLR
jgi:RNA polymerase sigma-B factor